jgi:hypothetical protein
MSTERDALNGDHDEVGRWLRTRLPRHAAPPGLRAALIATLAPAPPARTWTAWLSPAASALAMALVMLLWIAPSLPISSAPDPLRPITRAVMNDHAKTILWGEAQPDVVPARLPRAMDESGVGLSSVFAGDDQIWLVSAQPTYLEGRRGMELAYRDRGGHAVTYLIVPEPTLVLPERPRVQIDRWRPLVRRENGFSLLIWKQQALLCILISDLVSDEDFGKLKEYFVKVRESSEPYAF